MTIRHHAVFLIVVLMWQQYQVDAKIFRDNCELVRALRPHHMPHDLANWVCLIIAESTRNTAATHRNNDGSIDYGLFQINSRYWCRQGHVGGECHKNYFLKDDITDSAKCAKLIYARHGFSAWYGWTSKCQGKPLPDISKC